MIECYRGCDDSPRDEITVTAAMVDAATTALTNEAVFSDDYGNKCPDPVAAKAAIVAALEAGGFVVKIAEDALLVEQSPYRIL